MSRRACKVVSVSIETKKRLEAMSAYNRIVFTLFGFNLSKKKPTCNKHRKRQKRKGKQ